MFGAWDTGVLERNSDYQRKTYVMAEFRALMILVNFPFAKKMALWN